MKGVSKTALTFSSVFLAAGIALCAAGWLAGGNPAEEVQRYQSQVQEWKGGRAEVSSIREFQGISSIELSVGAAVCVMTGDEGDSVRIETSQENLLACSQHGKTLTVEYGKQAHSFWSWVGRANQQESVIYISVPKSVVLKELDLELGAADFTAEGIACDVLDLECGAGKAAFAGEIRKEGTVSCGAGSIALALKGEERDFNYSLECGLGSIQVSDGIGIAGIGEEDRDNNAGRDLDLECGLGSITVDFTDSI